jgi:hypothetical protein
MMSPPMITVTMLIVVISEVGRSRQITQIPASASRSRFQRMNHDQFCTLASATGRFTARVNPPAIAAISSAARNWRRRRRSMKRAAMKTTGNSLSDNPAARPSVPQFSRPRTTATSEIAVTKIAMPSHWWPV